MLRVQDQAKQAAHSEPPFSISFSEERQFSTPDPKKENNKGTLDKS
jgi:hypothetical protein